jgi:hypothetical protein
VAGDVKISFDGYRNGFLSFSMRIGGVGFGHAHGGLCGIL